MYKNINGIIIGLSQTQKPIILDDSKYKIHSKLCTRLFINLKECFKEPSLEKQKIVEKIFSEENSTLGEEEVNCFFFCNPNIFTFSLIVMRRNYFTNQCTLKYITKDKSYNVVDFKIEP